MSEWYAFETIAERNSVVEIKRVGVCCYVNEYPERYYCDGKAWLKLGMENVPVHPPETPVSPQPPEPEPNEQDLYRNPFNRCSAHHRSKGTGAKWFIPAGSVSPLSGIPVYIGAGRVLTPDSPNPLSNVGRLTVKAGNQGVKPYYRVDPGDQRRPIGRQPGSPANCGLPFVERMPKGVWLPDGPGDCDLLLYTRDAAEGGDECSMYFEFQDKAGTARFRRERKLSGTDTMEDREQDRGSSASGVFFPGTLLQGKSLLKPTPLIDYCLNCTATRHNKAGATDAAHILAKTMVWPAYSRDSSAGDPGNNKGYLPYGTRLAIPEWFWAAVDAIVLTPVGHAFAECFKGHGLYVLDGSGQSMDNGRKGIMQIRIDQDIMPNSPLADECDRQLALLLPYLRPHGNPRPHHQETELADDGNPYWGGGDCAGWRNTAYDAA